MARTPPVTLTKAEEKLERKLRQLLRKKRFKDVKAQIKKLNRNSAGRKMLRAVFGFGLRIAGSKLLWLGALGYAGYEYGDDLLALLEEDSGATDEQRDEAITEIWGNVPDRNFVTETPEGDPLQARILSQEEVEEARLDLQAAAAEEEAAQREEQLFPPEIQRARATARAEAQQMRPTGTFARGQAEPTWGMLDRRLGDDYTPSAGGTSSLINQLTDAQRQELREEGGQYPPFSPGQPFQYTEERKFWPDLRVGPRPQPVQTPWEQQPWNEDVSQAEIYGPDDRQAALASLQAQQQLGEEVEAGELSPLLQRPSPHEGLQPIIAPPSAPPTGPEIEYPGEVKRYESMPTTEEAAEFDFPDLLERITDEEALVAEAQGIAGPETGPEQDADWFAPYEEGAKLVGKTAVDIAGALGRMVYNSATGVFEKDDDAQVVDDQATGIVLDARGNILSTGEVAEEGDVSTTSTSAKEGLKEQGKREVVQTNVDATVNKYNLSPNIGQTLSQIEKNAGILRAASVMMGVKDISSNYRDMSIGQLRLARDIVEDLNGGQGPWKTWWSPDGTRQENLPIKGAAAEPRPGWVDTNPVPRLTGVAKLVQSTKQKIKDGQPWSAYQDAIDYDIAGGFTTEQKHTMTADLMTAWMKEFNPELTSSFKWPTRTEYDLWENGKMTDEQFRGFYGFTFQR